MGTQQAEMAQRVLLLCSLAFAWVSAAPVVRPSSARNLLGHSTNGTRVFSAKLTNTGLSGKQAPDASGTAIITLYRDNTLETFIRWDLILPEFGRLCDQSSTTTGLIPYTGVACTLTGAGSPCFNSGNSTLASLGSYLRQATPDSIYINLHTTRSREAAFPKPLGLIRGQLKAL